MTIKVFIKESETGHLIPVNKKGEVVGCQESSVIEQCAGDMTRFTVTFLLDPGTQMYRPGEEV